PQTFDISSASYYTFYFDKTTFSIENRLMVNEGSTAEGYTEYNPIELCKIGDYEDILFKNVVEDENYNAELDSGAWYKKEVIDKHIFNGSSDDTYNLNADNTTTLAVNLLPNKVDIPTFKYNNGNINSMYCDKFKYNFAASDFEHIYITGALKTDNNNFYGNVRLYIDKSRLEGYSSSLTNEQKITLLKNYLNANPITTYYILRYPTYTKITDPTLISQLEALRKAKWFKGVNHWWTETENLEPALEGTYKQELSGSEVP
ncbi:MAG: hypothetical protein IJ690_04975, partial [Clostridia bacterium]|nr:hypothetical protein [Clostridia bacterium]